MCALPELLSASSLFQDEVKITIYHLRREVKWKFAEDFVAFLQKKEPKKRKTHRHGAEDFHKRETRIL